MFQILIKKKKQHNFNIFSKYNILNIFIYRNVPFSLKNNQRWIILIFSIK